MAFTLLGRLGMAAWVGDGETEVRVGLLARLQAVYNRLARFRTTNRRPASPFNTSSASLNCSASLRVLTIAVSSSPENAQDHVALRLPALALQVGQGRGDHGQLELVVHRAAAEHIAVLEARGVNRSRCQSSRFASTTSMWPMTSSGFFLLSVPL